MIIPNGTISFKAKQAAGIDPETGYPVKPSGEEWGRPIPCQYSAVKYSNLAATAAGEHFTLASYSLLVEMQPLPSEQLRLTDRHGRELGRFSVIKAEELEAVGQVRITV